VQLPVTLNGPELHVARLEPYGLGNLDSLLAWLRKQRRVSIETIGFTVERRPLEIIRIGDPRAPWRVFVRARAHPWEAGSSWVLEGLARRLAAGDETVRRYLRRYCVYLMPMANKDGVLRGGTRFNLNGMDLNRNWDKPADARLAPENFALEQWLEKRIRDGQRPHLAIELHNDGNGRLHISRPPISGLEEHLKRMARFEQLLRSHTWFTEGSTGGGFRNSGTLGDGWLERYGIDSVVHELNCNWIEGLKDYPSAKHWQQYGASLAGVLDEYFGSMSVTGLDQ
jgi:hypothetical protein